MPTYLYQCELGHEFEVSQGIKDDPLTKCTVLHTGPPLHGLPCEEACKRLINFEGGISFRGTGWTPKHFK